MSLEPMSPLFSGGDTLYILLISFYYLVAGLLLDRFEFRLMMPVISLLLTINLASIYFVAQYSFIGLIVSVWLIYLLGFAHFATIPAQVLINIQF